MVGRWEDMEGEGDTEEASIEGMVRMETNTTTTEPSHLGFLPIRAAPGRGTVPVSTAPPTIHHDSQTLSTQA